MQKKKFSIKAINKIPKKNCFICKKNIPKEDLIFENKNLMVFLDLYPPTKGYIIIATKKHYINITDLTEKEYLEFQEILYKVSGAIKSAFNPKRICLLNSGGLLNHLHFHIIPMYKEVYNNFIDIILKKTILKLSKKERLQIASKIKNKLKFLKAKTL